MPYARGTVRQRQPIRKESVSIMVASIRQFAQFGHFVNSALASGKHDDITIEAVFRESAAEHLVEFLERRFGPATDINIDPALRSAINDAFSRISNVVEVEQFGLVESSRGLGLVMAMLLEEIQIREMETQSD